MTSKKNNDGGSALQGATVHPVDAHGRMTFKEHQHNVLPRQLYLTQGLDRCIQVLTSHEWEKLAGRLANLPDFDPDADDLKRVFRSSCAEVIRDDQRRIKLPPALRAWAGLEEANSRALMLDLGTRFEIWEEERYHRYIAERSKDLKEVARRIWGSAPAKEAEDEAQ